MVVIKKLIIAMIRFYQRFISPAMGPCCRFSPTCSQYGIEAVQRHGAFFGTGMTIWRILRCNPWNPGGYDPVPEERKRIFKSGIIKSKNNNYKTIEYKAVKDREKK